MVDGRLVALGVSVVGLDLAHFALPDYALLVLGFLGEFGTVESFLGSLRLRLRFYLVISRRHSNLELQVLVEFRGSTFLHCGGGRARQEGAQKQQNLHFSSVSFIS